MTDGLLAPPATVAAPSRTRLPYGLFSVLSPSTSEERWAAGGVQWGALTCEPAAGLPVRCDLSELLDGDGDRLYEANEHGPSWGRARPFTVHGYFNCGPVGWTLTEARARAEEHLRAREQSRVEQAFWTGDLDNYPNLAGATEGYGGDGYFEAPTNIGTFGYVDAIAELEEFIAANYGSVGVLHMPRPMALRMMNEGLVERRSQGGTLYTLLGTPVVAGAGYTGSEVRATPALFGFQSEVEFYTDDRGHFNPRTNDVLAVASRQYLIGFDPCGQASVTIENGNGGDVTFPDTMNVTVTEPVEVSNFPEPVTEVSVSNLPDNQDVTVTNTPLPVEQVTEES